MIVKMSDIGRKWLWKLEEEHHKKLAKKKEGEVGWIPKWYVGSHKERMERNIGLETIKEDHPT